MCLGEETNGHFKHTPWCAYLDQVCVLQATYLMLSPSLSQEAGLLTPVTGPQVLSC